MFRISRDIPSFSIAAGADQLLWKKLPEVDTKHGCGYSYSLLANQPSIPPRYSRLAVQSHIGTLLLEEHVVGARSLI